ncbi:DUF6814 family protein [Spirosoma rigui]|uniref:DUF6814 family protein n=1 Tax=Spirosoma rigui TaxID=564064 RepID=UPI0009B14579|nr:hypothetical protein [Spirosoma rigui]
MNTLKRYLGILWLALAALCAYFTITSLGIPKLTSGKTDDLVFGLIIVFVLMPIIVGGLVRFGLYALQGEYDD